jgi:hypothetical protein
MDIKTLVVGQNVFMRSGEYGDWGKVVEITPTGAVVQSIFEEPTLHWPPNERMIRFDNKGIACESCDYKGGFVEGTKIPGTESGPWELYLNPLEAGF